MICSNCVNRVSPRLHCYCLLYNLVHNQLNNLFRSFWVEYNEAWILELSARKFTFEGFIFACVGLSEKRFVLIIIIIIQEDAFISNPIRNGDVEKREKRNV